MITNILIIILSIIGILNIVVLHEELHYAGDIHIENDDGTPIIYFASIHNPEELSRYREVRVRVIKQK